MHSSNKIVLLLFLLVSQVAAVAQQSNAAAYEKLMQLTGLFSGNQPYTCSAIVTVKYKRDSKNVTADTSKLIYKNGMTYYKSKRVERVAASQGELIINHELKSATFAISDSVKELLSKELKIEPDREFESLLDSNFEERDLDAFKRYLVEHCHVVRDIKDGVEEIIFTPKNPNDIIFLAIKIRFTQDDRIQYYEYSNNEIYATDMNGKKKYRYMSTIYDNFTYDKVPDIPARLSDYIEWEGWSVKLKKYTNYKFSLL